MDVIHNIKIPSVHIGSIDPAEDTSLAPSGEGGQPVPITYLTKWKIVGNSEVHGQEIWSCGEYSAVDGKYHILVQPLGGSIADIALDEPLRKVNDVADTIEFPSDTEGKALVTRNVVSKIVSAYTNKDGSQLTTTLPDNTILHIKQFVKNGDFSDGTNSWNRTRHVSISASNNKLHIITNEAGASENNYSWAGVNEAVRAEVAVNENVYIHYTANPNRNMNVGLDGTGGGVYAQECVQNIDNDISCVKKLTTVNAWYFGFNRGTHEINDEVIISNVYSFDLDAMFADCPSLKPSTASDFEVLFTNLSYIDYSSDTQEVIVNDGKLYKEDVIGIEILVPLTTPTTELVDAPQIEKADSYSCEISQGAKAVSWSSFNTN